VAYNSKVFYIVTQGAGLGDNVRRLPITGNDCVLDAIAQVNGLSQISSKRIWIARPAPHNFGCQQILPIDWDAIAAGAQTATNYQLLPGDRLYISEDELSTFTNVVGKVTAPFERIAGILGLGNGTIRGFQTAGRNYNRTRNGL
jgi:polysaccharide biosynthesis/export protein